MKMLSEAKLRLERAQEAYAYALAQIDRMLKPMIAASPEALVGAKALQASYLKIAYVPADLKIAEQPKAEASKAKAGK